MRHIGVTLIVLAAGCGSEDPPGVADAPVPDAPSDAKVFDPDEGGEVRVEYVRFAGGEASARVTAFLYGDPGSTRFFRFPNTNGCTDLSSRTYWPVAQNPIGERTYLDPGKIILAGGPQILDVARHTAEGADEWDRTHPAGAWFSHFGGPAADDAATYLAEKTKLDVIFAGSANLPAQIFDDVLYMPTDFALMSPGTDDVALPAGTPQTFTWTTPASMPPPGYEVSSHVVFTGADGPAVLCIEPDDGTLTVPTSMIDVVRAKYPTGGTLVRQLSTHVIRELVDRSGRTGQRIDFIAAWGYETTFTVP
ncbi:MAG TPA: hypothetical protein VK932_05300 [Kofleriaceae bacterium]|nr:hypothetical protein [Kofleriaceae bacterium]